MKIVKEMSKKEREFLYSAFLRYPLGIAPMKVDDIDFVTKDGWFDIFKKVQKDSEKLTPEGQRVLKSCLLKIKEA